MSFRQFTERDIALIREQWTELHKAAESRCRTPEELQVVEKAFDFANSAHNNVRRRSGDPYMIHPIGVARIVIEEIGLGYKSIAAALLHDVVEDTDYTVEDIRTLFGDKIAQLVDGLTKIKTVLDNDSRNKESTVITESLQAENFKRILLSLGDDARVVLIKMADRLHNCRTIEFMPERKRDKILSETMYIFIPLAHRLGLYSIKSEMENIWLRYKEPEDYASICRSVEQNVALKDKEIDEFITPIEAALKMRGFCFEIKKRVKTPYSIWKKMRTKHIPFEEIFDLYAVRIIYEPSDNDPEQEREDAFKIYSAVCNLYRAKPDRWRNWIEHPKSNGYEALHCTLMSHSGVWVEVQIRSRRMDDIAEKGIAAHWAYKNDGYSSDASSEMDRWLSKVQTILQSDDVTTLELLDIIHNDLISNDIVVFTPKGEQKSVPFGATALDYGFLIHSRIGEKAIACKINMKLAPLSATLKAGDQVEIITAANAAPQIEWLQFLQTRTARSRVMEYFRSCRDELCEKGKEIYRERVTAMGGKTSNALLKKFLIFCQINDTREFFFRVALGVIGPEVFRRVFTENDLSAADNNDAFVIGSDDRDKRFIMADCCHPIPGDPVVGFVMEDGTVVVHKKSCINAQNYASKFGGRIIVPEWEEHNGAYPIRISLKGIDRLGLLNDITSCISLAMGMNIRKLQLGAEGGLFEGFLELYVHDRKNLDTLLDRLQKVDGVQNVVRTDILE